jgi:hypothetical protein
MKKFQPRKSFSSHDLQWLSVQRVVSWSPKNIQGGGKAVIIYLMESEIQIRGGYDI